MVGTVTDRFGVSPADLIAHARHVESIEDQVRAAGLAGAAVRAGGDAYGQLCAMVPAMLGALQDVVVEAIGSAANGLSDSGTALRSAAREYAETDDLSRRQFERIQDRL
jgi:hypothetical protein